MVETKNTRSHVSGFVKRLKENKLHSVVTFQVARQKFILPASSTFGTTIRLSHTGERNVLVLFEITSKEHPRILGVIASPTWPQVRAASDGEDFFTVKAICPDGRRLN